MTGELVVSVTTEHIAAGERNLCQKCPIALAVREVSPPGGIVEVGDPEVRVYLPAGAYEAELPFAADRFISDFDNGRPVEPFTMTLRFEPVVDDWEDD